MRDSEEISTDGREVLRSLLRVGLCMYTASDLTGLLDKVLGESRALARAEAGSLYIMRDKRLHFCACQNDRLALPEITRNLLNKEVAVSPDSLAGFVGATGRVVNIPNAYALPAGSPFRMNRDFDAATGYRTRSVLAMPLICPDGQCVGVLELINRLSPTGRIIPFPIDNGDELFSLAAMAAVAVQNRLLREQLRQAHLDTIIRLVVAAEFRDEDTANHIRRISDLSTILSRGLGMEGEFLELIGPASTMHDIGKIGIPDAILLKPGALTPQERQIVERHVQIGADIIGPPSNPLLALARDVAMTHHERWNGKGYPAGLAGERIPLAGRIVGLVDVFDALVCKRCYKTSCPRQEALDLVKRESGKHFDPRVVRAFLEVRDDVWAIYDRLNEPGGADKA